MSSSSFWDIVPGKINNKIVISLNNLVISVIHLVTLQLEISLNKLDILLNRIKCQNSPP